MNISKYGIFLFLFHVECDNLNFLLHCYLVNKIINYLPIGRCVGSASMYCLWPSDLPLFLPVCTLMMACSNMSCKIDQSCLYRVNHAYSDLRALLLKRSFQNTERFIKNHSCITSTYLSICEINMKIIFNIFHTCK